MAKAKTETNGKLRPVIVCTEFRGVFYGLAGDTTGDGYGYGYGYGDGYGYGYGYGD